MKNYNYKQTEVNTLRLMLDFGKFKNDADIDTAYNILQLKEKKKAQYILNAITYYDECINKQSDMRRLVFNLRQLDFLKERYNLKSKESIISLLSISKNDSEYKKIEAKIPKHKTPAKMLCGFTIGDEESEAMHKRLFTQSVNDRIFLISSAVLTYVQDGHDPRAKAILSYIMLKDLIDEYQNEVENRQNLVNNLYAMFKISGNIVSNAPQKKESDLSKDLLKLFIDEDEIEGFLK